MSNTKNLFFTSEPSAEEIIAEIYRQISIAREVEKHPTAVILSIDYIRRIRIFHGLLGPSENPSLDYISNYSIFGLEFLVGPPNTIQVVSTNK